MTFTANVPQGNQKIAATQSPIQTNFQLIDSAFNDATNGNFSKYVIGNVGTVSAPVDPVSIFHTLNGLNFFLNKPIPYFSNSVGDYPMLPDLKTVGTNKGFKFGNIIVNFGSGTITAVSQTVTFAIPFSVGVQYSASVIPTTTGSLTEGQWSVQTNDNVHCTFYRGSSTAGTIGFLYIVIGT